MFVPAGFAAVAPYLVVHDAPGFIDFLVSGLGGTHVGSSLRPNGTIANGQVRFGEDHTAATIMVGESRDGSDLSSVALYLYVADADRAFAQAVAAGAEGVMAVGDQPYGDRQSGVTDRWGMTWWLSQRLTAAPYDFED